MKTSNQTIHQLTVPTPFAVGDTHVYLLKGDALTLVDAGVKTKAAWEALKSQLRELGYYPNDIEQLILTHHHPDHIGLIEQFPRLNEIIAHEEVNVWLTSDKLFLEQYLHFFENFFAICGIYHHFPAFKKELHINLSFGGKGKLTSTINEGDCIQGHEEWQVIETKGHAQSHVSFLNEQDGTFIGGDHLLHHISPNPLLEAPRNQKDRPKPLLQYRMNLKKCLALGIKKVFPGHGIIFSDVDQLIANQLNRQEKLANKVFLLLKKESLTPFQICQQLYPRHYRKELSLTMSETIGQLDFLESENLIEQRQEDGLLYFQTTKK